MAEDIACGDDAADDVQRLVARVLAAVEQRGERHESALRVAQHERALVRHDRLELGRSDPLLWRALLVDILHHREGALVEALLAGADVRHCAHDRVGQATFLVARIELGELAAAERLGVVLALDRLLFGDVRALDPDQRL